MLLASRSGHFTAGDTLDVVFSHIDRSHLDVEWEVTIANARLTFPGGASKAGAPHHNVPPFVPCRVNQPLLATGLAGHETLAYARVRYRTAGWASWRVWFSPAAGHSVSAVV